MWDIKKEPSQKDRVVIVTGANSGIGFETALQLAKKDATVIMACRNIVAANFAKSKILGIYPKAQISTAKLDLSSLKSVRAFADDFLAKHTKLDLLINNAGIMMSPYKETEDGFENQLATNFIGHFALTGLLLKLIQNTPKSRVVTLSSLAYKWAFINFDDLHFKKGYSKKKAYGQSKRSCLMFSYELNRLLSQAKKETISVAAHPGLSKTNLDRYFPKLIRPLGNLFLQSSKNGALPVLYAALKADLKGSEYIGPDGFQELKGYPTIVDSDLSTKDKSVAQKLWKVAEEITGVKYEFD